MKKLGIIRPCKIGDLIISLPIGKYYFERGYEVHWPIMEKYYASFNEMAGHYIKFIPITNSDFFAVTCARQELININVKDIINLTFNIGGFDDVNSLLFKKSKLRFDKFIYKLAEVPFENKWNLEIKRNIPKEDEAYSKLTANRHKYSLCHFDVVYNKYGWPQGYETRKGYFNLCKKLIKNDIIEIHPNQNISNIFYWIKILENSDQIFAVDSSIANLVEGLNLKNEKYFLEKGSNSLVDSPELKNNWILI